MAVLPDGDRLSVWAELMQRLSLARDSINITKADLRTAINAADDWANTNAASYNSALPQPARGALTSAQKALILMLVVSRRWTKE
jgi:hypothetical protein